MLESILKCDVLCITEHWLKHFELQTINVSNFDLGSCYCRPTIGHGGSCIYVSKNIKFKEIDCNCFSVEQVCEVSAVELTEQNIVIICVYRSNLTNVSQFYPCLERLLDFLVDSGKDCVVLGDFNIDFLSPLNNTQKRLNDILNIRNYSNIVDFHTRVTASTSTCIDHAYVSDERVQAGGVRVTAVNSRLSDHYAIRAELSCARDSSPAPPRFARTYSRANTINFVSSIESIDWVEVCGRQLPAARLAETIINIFKYMLDVCFPIKRLIKTTNRSTWVTKEILGLDSVLREIKGMSYNYPTNSHLSLKLHEFQERVANVVKKERSKYYCDIIAGASNTTKKMWDVVKIETGRDGRKQDLTEYLRTPNGSRYLCQ